MCAVNTGLFTGLLRVSRKVTGLIRIFMHKWGKFILLNLF